ncbi:MAG TPA: hypothetical protein VJB69_01685 [Candidatus Paceibacterota bacterium]
MEMDYTQYAVGAKIIFRNPDYDDNSRNGEEATVIGHASDRPGVHGAILHFIEFADGRQISVHPKEIALLATQVNQV